MPLDSVHRRLAHQQQMSRTTVQRWRTRFMVAGRLVDQVMSHEPYRSARRVFWIADNGSSHRGERAAEELRERHPRIVVVHTPVHASWLNQIEVRRTQNSSFAPS